VHEKLIWRQKRRICPPNLWDKKHMQIKIRIIHIIYMWKTKHLLNWYKQKYKYFFLLRCVIFSSFANEMQYQKPIDQYIGPWAIYFHKCYRSVSTKLLLVISQFKIDIIRKCVLQLNLISYLCHSFSTCTNRHLNLYKIEQLRRHMNPT